MRSPGYDPRLEAPYGPKAEPEGQFTFKVTMKLHGELGRKISREELRAGLELALTTKDSPAEIEIR